MSSQLEPPCEAYDPKRNWKPDPLGYGCHCERVEREEWENPRSRPYRWGHNLFPLACVVADAPPGACIRFWVPDGIGAKDCLLILEDVLEADPDLRFRIKRIDPKSFMVEKVGP